MTDDEARELLREKVKEAGGHTAFARAHRVDRSTISLVLGAGKQDKKITPQIARALGLRKVTVWVPD